MSRMAALRDDKTPEKIVPDATRSTTLGSALGSRTAATLTVLGLLVAVVALGRWFTHPSVFGETGNGLDTGSLPVSRAVAFTAVTSTDQRGEVHEVTFCGASAHFTRNTAGATASFAVCTPRPGGDPVAGGIGDPAAHRAELRPLTDGTKMAYTSDHLGECVTMTLTAARPGTAHVDRVDLQYALGLKSLYRRGTERIPVDAALRAR
jgi:hypothetical protein